VLVPLPTRDILLRLAVTGLFRARWSHEILDEMDSALISRGMAGSETVKRNRACMIAAIADGIVTWPPGIADHIPLDDPGDRHVIAAAISGAADVIVTANERHFPRRLLDAHGLTVEHPDDFLVTTMTRDVSAAIVAVREQRADLRKRPLDPGEFLLRFDRAGLPRTAEFLRDHLHAI